MCYNKRMNETVSRAEHEAVVSENHLLREQMRLLSQQVADLEARVAAAVPATPKFKPKAKPAAKSKLARRS